MIYIPVKIKEFIKDNKGEKFVICDAIMNSIPLTEFRNIKKVKLDLIKIKRKTFNVKIIRKGQTYTLTLKNNEYKNCNDKDINEWGDYVFDKYENYINKEYNKKVKQKNHKNKNKNNRNVSFWDNLFDLGGLGDIKIN